MSGVARSAEREHVTRSGWRENPTAARADGAWKGLDVVTDAVLDVLQSVLGFVVGLFPTTSVDVFAYVDQIASNLGALNYFLPIAELVALVLSVVVLFPVFMGISLTLWVIAQLRGSSSVG